MAIHYNISRTVPEGFDGTAGFLLNLLRRAAIYGNRADSPEQNNPVPHILFYLFLVREIAEALILIGPQFAGDERDEVICPAAIVSHDPQLVLLAQVFR